ncbi:hypothetical protein SAMN03159338_1525 [Sphingomonas sp. NFR04]|jgi:hypothetical protein|nr:hypothetical protein [Sphingomonas sp. NFR04]SFJ48514.1 hypothetical protein SAMN03159338_1525 [Sphingomonas sp. NFR04]
MLALSISFVLGVVATLFCIFVAFPILTVVLADIMNNETRN